ncbi:MAG: septum formation initiator family protein [Bacteroidales bacterium]|jgi:cell division protein FtsB|nr:septum formation initiator family protein [Bacteroidales bacterium]
MEKFKKLWLIIKDYKFLITIIAFILWIVFFDSNSLINSMKNSKKIEDLNIKMSSMQIQIKELQQKNDELSSGKDAVEKYARENLLMKEKNEDVFIVDDNK